MERMGSADTCEPAYVGDFFGFASCRGGATFLR